MNCSLTIAGREDEVLDAAVDHAVSTHKHEGTPELRDQISVRCSRRKLTSTAAPLSPESQDAVRVLVLAAGARPGG